MIGLITVTLDQYFWKLLCAIQERISSRAMSLKMTESSRVRSKLSFIDIWSFPASTFRDTLSPEQVKI